jgi:hypothetical protein
MLVNSPLTADKYPEYIYGTHPNENNSRGRRAVELLENTPRMTLAQAIAIALDTHADMAEQWKDALAWATGHTSDRQLVASLQPAIILAAAVGRLHERRQRRRNVIPLLAGSHQAIHTAD